VNVMFSPVSGLAAASLRGAATHAAAATAIVVNSILRVFDNNIAISLNRPTLEV
jgi:hypothetical protein